MDTFNISQELKMRLYRWLKIAAAVFLIMFFFNALFDDGYDRKYDNEQQNTITFSGYGEVNAVPDIANIYFTISKEAKTVKEAQAFVAQIEKTSLEFLRKNKVLDKDIKTLNASFRPKYEYMYDDTKTIMPCTEYGCPLRQKKNVVTGYTASESITVKVRNTDDVGKIIEGLGTLGVFDLNGPNFAIDNEEGLKAEARRKAIIDAKEKARVLAKDLGVRLGDITSFSEGANYGIYYGKMTAVSSPEDSASAPAEIPKGENTISSDVTITYEIR